MVSLADKTREIFEHDELPPEFVWINDLAPRHQRLFFGELQFEWSRYCLTNEPAGLIELFEDWKATAEVDRNPEHAASLLASGNDDDYEEWNARAAS